MEMFLGASSMEEGRSKSKAMTKRLAKETHTDLENRHQR
jgi:hypothetical protein